MMWSDVKEAFWAGLVMLLGFAVMVFWTVILSPLEF